MSKQNVLAGIKAINGVCHAAIGGAATGWFLADRPFAGAGIAALASLFTTAGDELIRRWPSSSNTRPNGGPDNKPSGKTFG